MFYLRIDAHRVFRNEQRTPVEPAPPKRIPRILAVNAGNVQPYRKEFLRPLRQRLHRLERLRYLPGQLFGFGHFPYRRFFFVAGHHGSKYATGEELLNTLTPETVLISVGYNSYGHPAPETLDRLTEAGAEAFRTDQQGDLTVYANPKEAT